MNIQRNLSPHRLTWGTNLSRDASTELHTKTDSQHLSKINSSLSAQAHIWRLKLMTDDSMTNHQSFGWT